MSRLGEWWIDESGDTTYADGDLGDSNHEGIAKDHAVRLLAQAVGWDGEEIDLYGGELSDIIREWLEEEQDMTADEAMDTDLSQYLKDHAKEIGIEPHLVDAAFDRFDSLRDAGLGVEDIREYALKYWGWHWFKQDQIGTNIINEDTMRVISKGVEDIVDQQVRDPDDESVRSHGVYVMSLTRKHKSWFITIGDLLDYNYDGLEIAPHLPHLGRNAQVKAAENAIAEPYYKGKEGD